MSEEIRIITKDQYEEYMELKKQVADTTKKVRWKPALGDTFFLITSTTHIDSMRYLTGNSDVCEKIFKTGNCFETEAEAQKELSRRIAEMELLDMCDGDGNIEIRCRPNSGEFEPSGSESVFGKARFFIWSPYRFSTNESCQKAIDAIGEDKLRLIFRIED